MCSQSTAVTSHSSGLAVSEDALYRLPAAHIVGQINAAIVLNQDAVYLHHFFGRKTAGRDGLSVFWFDAIGPGASAGSNRLDWLGALWLVRCQSYAPHCLSGPPSYHFIGGPA